MPSEDPGSEATAVGGLLLRGLVSLGRAGLFGGLGVRLGLVLQLVLGFVIGLVLRRGLDLCTDCLLYTSPSPRDATLSRMPSSA